MFLSLLVVSLYLMTKTVLFCNISAFMSLFSVYKQLFSGVLEGQLGIRKRIRQNLSRKFTPHNSKHSETEFLTNLRNYSNYLNSELIRKAIGSCLSACDQLMVSCHPQKEYFSERFSIDSLSKTDAFVHFYIASPLWSKLYFLSTHTCHCAILQTQKWVRICS